MQGSLVGVGVRREGWALHNLFSLNLIKRKKRGSEKRVWECSAWEESYRSVLFQHLFLPQDPMELSIIPLLSRWGKEARRRVAEVAQQVSKS